MRILIISAAVLALTACASSSKSSSRDELIRKQTQCMATRTCNQ